MLGPILFISPQPFLSNRGSPLRVLSTVRALTELGFAVDLLVFPLGEETAIPGVTIQRSWKIPGINNVGIGPSWQKIAFDCLLGLKAFSLEFSKKYSIVHGIEEAAFIAAALSKWHGMPYIADMHSLLPEHLTESGFVRSKTILDIVRKSYIRCLQNASGIVGVSEELCNWARQTAPAVRCCQLEDLPLDSVFEDNSSRIRDLKNEWALDDRKIILYTGNFNEYQGIDLLLQAFALLLAELRAEVSPSPLLVLVGESSETVLQKYRKQALSLGIEKDVLFTGERPREEMGAVMGLADLLVSPRIKGGNTPLKIYSYMASAVPIVATKISSHTQVLNEDSAFLSDITPGDLAQQLRAALDSSPTAKQRRMSMVESAKQIVNTRFNKKVFTSRLATLYGNILGVRFHLEEHKEEGQFRQAVAE